MAVSGGINERILATFPAVCTAMPSMNEVKGSNSLLSITFLSVLQELRILLENGFLQQVSDSNRGRQVVHAPDVPSAGLLSSFSYPWRPAPSERVEVSSILDDIFDSSVYSRSPFASSRENQVNLHGSFFATQLIFRSSQNILFGRTILAFYVSTIEI